MAEIPTVLRPRLQTWWMSLDGGTQTIFEAIYMEAPAAVSRAVSAGEWVADSAEPGLAAQLGADAGAALAAIPGLVAGLPELTPFHAQPGQAVTVKWTELNNSQADLGAYVTDVYVTSPAGDTIAQERLPGAGVAANASFDRTWRFTAGNEPGMYAVAIYLNAEGADPGSGVPGAQGIRGYTSAGLEVGGGEGAAASQDFLAWTSALAGLQSVSTLADPQQERELIRRLEESINWMVAFEGLTAVERDIAAQFGSWLQNLQPGRLAADEALATKLATIAGTASQSGDYSDEAGRRRVFDALTALQR